ncbi:MAG: tRNA 2-thiouridine(34) synthase MnmA [Candidatus Pacebacteria bacterium]|nr:tRNA 2-thiouridine(34) synthase MnmA [Candidatus Paceibacterota bacterium]
MIQTSKKIVVGLSGGIDSSVALLLLKKQGWLPVGVSLKYAVWQDPSNKLRENICFNSESFEIAQKVCRQLNVPYYFFDVSQEFKKEVIDYFIAELKRNRTPNPCLICNRFLKLKKLFVWAKKEGINYVATGHYARIKKDDKTKKYQLLAAKDKQKDQTYSLAFLTQKWLNRIVFPLGDRLKSEVYQLALKEGFDFFLKRKESQDFCFVAGGNSLNCFLTQVVGQKEGPIKNPQDQILGHHQGLHFYTLGQRKGIKLAGGPYFVVEKRARDNALIVSKNKKNLFSSEAILSPLHFISGHPPQIGRSLRVKIRSRHPAIKATLSLINQDKAKVIFQEPQRAVTPGQWAVFYRGSVCLGGGKIVGGG